MSKDKKAFGNFLRKMIKQAEISQATFYEAVEITKPYFYDILSGKANPPPPDVQYKIIDKLNLDNQQRNEFLNLAAEGRGEIPADIAPAECRSSAGVGQNSYHADNTVCGARTFFVYCGAVFALRC